ncbi:VtaA26 protein [Mesorhizobium loti]|nr:VtaA26 protein [Mesorhizobium loti]
MKEWLAYIFELCLYLVMQNLSSLHGAVAPASREANKATEVASHSLPSRPSSPAGAKPERFDASGPVCPSLAAGTAGAAAPLGSGPPFDRHDAGPYARSCIRTQDGTVILFEPMTGRAVSAPDRKTAEARLARLSAGHSIRSG